MKASAKRKPRKRFYIEKRAIYLHAVYGPFSTRKAALNAFARAYKADNSVGYFSDFDGHHDYFLVDGLTEKIGERASEKGELIPYESKRGM